MDLLPKYDDDKPWWQNRGCKMRFQMSDSQGVEKRQHIVEGVLHRIDASEYQKYVVVDIGGGNCEHINIDHIIKVAPTPAPKEN